MASMSKEERAKEYCKQLCNNPTQETAKKIANSINRLVYSNTEKPISSEYKMELIGIMEQNWTNFYPILEHAENQSILALISQIKATIKNN